MSNDPQGSLWRRWDLHLHTPITRLSNAYENAGTDATWDSYIDFLEASPVHAFGVTEYFGVDAFFEVARRYKAKYPASSKVLFPNIELRLSESISRTGNHPHLHIIFDNDPKTSNPETLKRFCTHLETQSSDDSDVCIRCVDLDTSAKIMAATVSLDQVLDALKETFGTARPYLLAFPANNDGLRSTDSNSLRKVALADKIDKACQVFFGNAGNSEYFLRKDRYAGDIPSEAIFPKIILNSLQMKSRLLNLGRK